MEKRLVFIIVLVIIAIGVGYFYLPRSVTKEGVQKKTPTWENLSSSEEFAGLEPADQKRLLLEFTKMDGDRAFGLGKRFATDAAFINVTRCFSSPPLLHLAQGKPVKVVNNGVGVLTLNIAEKIRTVPSNSEITLKPGVDLPEQGLHTLNCSPLIDPETPPIFIISY